MTRIPNYLTVRYYTWYHQGLLAHTTFNSFVNRDNDFLRVTSNEMMRQKYGMSESLGVSPVRTFHSNCHDSPRTVLATCNKYLHYVENPPSNAV